MSDHSITIVPRQSSYPDKEAKAEEILNWLTSQYIVSSTLSDCVLSSDNGYAISDGAARVTNLPNELPFNLITNGLDVITKRQVFHTGGNGMDECICPNCKENIASEEWSFLNDWDEQKSNDLTCPLCNFATEHSSIHIFTRMGF